ncbi:MAG: tRNA (cytidine(34)-2'-O)-methyltransferase [Deltaproteobacteria bacterium]|nr:tRNA (cytidine(34)-2'-O)-methyltransferase [Deltaproteobacteria bacterium]
MLWCHCVRPRPPSCLQRSIAGSGTRCTAVTPSPPSPAAEPVLHVVLVQPEIPPNTGSIARLCAATRVRLHLVGPLGFSLEDRYLKRAGLDYWPHVDLRVYPDWQAFDAVHGGDRLIYFSARAPRSYLAVTHAPGEHLVFGGETRGLPRVLLAAHADSTFTIPIFSPHVRSLNLANAVAIVVYDALRQLGRLPAE